MGQISTAPSLGITVRPVDRESGPGAGAGATGNNSLFLGLNAGQGSAINDFVVLGSLSGEGGIVDTVNLNGTTIVGAKNLQTATAAVAANGAIVILGDSNLQSVALADSTVAIGQNIFKSATGTITGNVLIGNNIGAVATNTGISTSVVIGQNALQAVNALATSTNDVIIGYEAAQNVANNASFSDTVMIGYRAGTTLTDAGGATSGNVLIGSQSDLSANGSSNNVAIGFLAKCSSSAPNNVAIGHSAQAGSLSDANGSNVVIGASALISGGSTNGRNIVIGGGAGTTTPVNLSDLLVIETNVGGTQRAMFYGNLATGNVVIGNSIDGTNRDLIVGGAATNIVKLLNGTIGGANPVGGGYFYVTGGTLHWVDSGGVDSTLSHAVSGQIGNSSTTLTNNAAGNAGTITNAPAVGNPTKWAPFNDNGTIRNIPMW